jgi:deoxyribodipyrimidine photo-lyase
MAIQEVGALINNQTTLFWFRRDLRLHDNAGLYHALRENKNVLPLFIFDTQILDNLPKTDRRVEFIYRAVKHLRNELHTLGSSLLVLHGDPIKLFKSLNPHAVYTNHDFEPYATQRDEAVRQWLKRKDILFRTCKDHVVFEKNEIVKDDGQPYTVFTPYSRKWKAKLNDFYLKQYPTGKYFTHLKQTKRLPFPALEELGFEPVGNTFPKSIIPRAVIERYDSQRNFPAIHGTTRLSVHLRFGTISIRKLAQVARRNSQALLNELIWRDFYAMIIYHFPQVQTRSFKPGYDHIAWRNNEAEFKRWCEGSTGYALVDAGMRELNQTGFMHNRVRMVTASFLVKHLLIDWRWGEAYFAEKLLDYDLASNNGGWQWAAGSGCDAAPYFRVFNPVLQAKKFDPDETYIRKWIPEYATPAYPPPMVDHNTARNRALSAYKKALRQHRP